MMDLAKRNRQLVMKIPTNAGGLDNITALSKDILNRPRKVVYSFISEKFRATVLLKTPNGKMTAHWIEANARRGGVSIPMTIRTKIVDNEAPVSVFVLRKFRGQGAETSLRQKLSKLGSPEIALRKNIKKGFVQLLSSSERLQLIAAYELDEREMELMSGI